MNCKNCQHELEANALFCDNCGGKVIKSRITFKQLFTELFANVFGLDSKYFLTLKKMLTAPKEVLEEYLSGVRKRYVNPFAYLAVGAALSLITFNFFADDFIAIQSSMNTSQTNELREIAKKDLSSIPNITKEELAKLKIKQDSAKGQLNFMDNYLQLILKYFNLMAFLFLPVYALISKWTYRKPNNYGEHIVINAYLQGTTMYFSIFAFLISMLTHPRVYAYSILISVFYYLFTFSTFYRHSFKKIILKLLRFMLVLLFILVIIIIIGSIIGILLKGLK